MVLVYDPVSGDSVGAGTGIMKQRRYTNQHRETALVQKPVSGNSAVPEPALETVLVHKPASDAISPLGIGDSMATIAF